MNIYFAPIQGQTDHIYRKAHHELIGGTDGYYTPFIRWEHDGVRKKDLRDADPRNNEGVPVVPQIIAKDRDEMCRLCDLLQEMGWHDIDINMGCPFPLQTHAGRGAGLLSHTDKIEHIVLEIQNRKEVRFSVKMRSGMEDTEEGLRTLPIFNEAGLSHLTLHPRLGREQYRGRPDMEVFEQFYRQYDGRMVYNGDLSTLHDIQSAAERFPQLHGVMIGRGLLQRPTLGKEYREGACDDTTVRKTLLQLHDRIYADALANLQGDSQILSKMQEFWSPLEGAVDKKTYKKLTKCGNLKNYNESLKTLTI